MQEGKIDRCAGAAFLLDAGVAGPASTAIGAVSHEIGELRVRRNHEQSGPRLSPAGSGQGALRPSTTLYLIQATPNSGHRHHSIM